MKNIYPALLFVAILIMGCKKEDTQLPTVNFTTTSTDFLVEKGKSFGVQYEISDDIGITSHKMEVVDGNNNVILSKDLEAKSGSFTATIDIEEDVQDPLIIKISAGDEAGNVGTGTLSLRLQGLDIRFRLIYDGEPVNYFDPVEYPTGDSILFSKVSFYLSNVKLDDKIVKEVDYVNLQKSATDSEDMDYYLYNSIHTAAGGYDRLSFDIGLPSELNAMKPADFDSKSPLARPDEYWNSWESYIFAKIEGRIDLDDETEGYEQPVLIHMGSDESLMKFEFDKSGNIGPERGIVTIDIDLEKVFDDNGDVYDIATTPTTHSLENLPQILIIRENMEKALSIN